MHHSLVLLLIALHLDLCGTISGGCVNALLRTDLGVLLNGDVLVGFEG